MKLPHFLQAHIKQVLQKNDITSTSVRKFKTQDFLIIYSKLI